MLKIEISKVIEQLESRIKYHTNLLNWYLSKEPINKYDREREIIKELEINLEYFKELINMGLCIHAKGLEDLECGYGTFYSFRLQLAKTYNADIGNAYHNMLIQALRHNNIISNNYFNYLRKNCPKGLLTFLLHSDCDGKLTPKECRLIYNDIKDLKMDMMYKDFFDDNHNMLDTLKNMLYHCYTKRVNMYFD